MNKFYFLILVCLNLNTAYSQNQIFKWQTLGGLEGNFGLTIGGTNYITDSSLLFSKSGTGFLVGFTGSVRFSEKAELFVTLSYARHSSQFIGKQDPFAVQEEIPFHLEQTSVPFIFNYNFIEFHNDYKIGVFAGPSFNFFYNWDVTDDSKNGYLLEPLLATTDDLRFDREDISFNLYGGMGLSAQYLDKILILFKYERSITDPYRRVPIFSNFLDITGADTILSISATYFF